MITYTYSDSGRLRHGDTCVTLCAAIGYQDDAANRMTIERNEEQGTASFTFPVPLSDEQLADLDAWASSHGMGTRI